MKTTVKLMGIAGALLLALGISAHYIPAVDQALEQSWESISAAAFGEGRGEPASYGAEAQQETPLTLTPEESQAEFHQRLAEGIRAFEEKISVEVRLPGDTRGEAAETDYLMALVEEAMTAVRRDHPDIFWLSLGEYGVLWTGDRETGVFQLEAQPAYCMSRQEAQTLRREMDQVIGQVLSEAPADPYDAALYFHDWIVDRTTYDTHVSGLRDMEGWEYAYNIDGVFLKGSAVCEGYAKSFQTLCDGAGIPSRIVFGTSGGENHAWNYVRMEGSWYLVDCTADDPVSTVDILRWDYFMRGAVGAVGNSTVGAIYREDGGDYPALAPSDYREEDTPREEVFPGDWVVQLELHTFLTEGTPSAEPGQEVGALSMRGGDGGYTFRLTGEGDDDGWFSLDTGGVLSVGDRALPAGEYQLQVEVTGKGGAAVAHISILVEDAPG